MGMSIYAATLEKTAEFPQGIIDCIGDIEEAWTVSYATARLLFGKLGFDTDGEHFLFPISEVQAATLRALNDGTAEYTEATQVSRGALGATMISCGLDDGMLRGLLQRLAIIVRDGQSAGAGYIAGA